MLLTYVSLLEIPVYISCVLSYIVEKTSEGLLVIFDHSFVAFFLDHIDNHWLWRQNSSYLARKVAFCRICSTWHFFLCTTCCEYAWKNCKTIIETSVARTALRIQKAEENFLNEEQLLKAFYSVTILVNC